MRLEHFKFLGITSDRFDSNFHNVSLVNYYSPVSEEWHYHENTHLSLILQGGNMESRKKEDFEVKTGKVMFYEEGELHRNRFTAFPSKNLNIELKKEFFNQCDFGFNNPCAKNIESIDTFLSLLNIYKELRLNDSYSVESIFFSLNQLLQCENESSYIPKWIEELREIVEDRWDEFISLKELSRILRVLPVTISKYFRKYYKCTLGDYMRKIKVQRALSLLFNTNKSITEISHFCGFTDQSHMIKVFKAYIGFLPTEVRLV